MQKIRHTQDIYVHASDRNTNFLMPEKLASKKLYFNFFLCQKMLGTEGFH